MNSNGFLGSTELSKDDRELLNRLLKAGGVKTRESQAIRRRESIDEPLLSFAQQRLWFLDGLNPDSPFYNVAGAMRLSGLLNIPVLERSLEEIIRRHEALRTTFRVVEDHPIQVVNPVTSFELPVVKIAGASKAEQETEALRLASEEARKPFNLAVGPLLRVRLLELNEQDHLLLVAMHHIICDGWSIGVFVKELASLYEAFSEGKPSPLPDLPIQYIEFANWQRERLQGETLAAQLDYWRNELAGAPAVLNLPTDKQRPAVQSYAGSRHTFYIDRELAEGVKALSLEQGTTLFMTLLAAFKVLLSRYTAQQDIVVGSPIAGRSRVETEGLIGCFINTLVLRSDLSDNPRFVDLLARVRDTAMRAFDHQGVPFEKLVEELQPERDISRTPFFQVLFILQNAPITELKMAGINLRPVETQAETAKFDLTLSVEETGQGLTGSIEYSTDLFNLSTIKRMASHFQTLLEGIVLNPRRRISQLPIMPRDELHQLLLAWNDTARDYPQNDCIHDLFERQAALTPGVAAIARGRDQLTFDELNRRANRLGNYLVARGMKAEMLVGVCMERSIEMIVGLLGILKAGGAYVPLDPAYPKQRLAYMMEDAELRFVITQAGVLDQREAGEAELIFIDAGWEEISEHSDANLRNKVDARSLAYVIYTSGSTGKPKGVAIQHNSAVTLLHWAKDVFTPQDLRGVLASTSICFDLSVFEIFVPLSWGGRILLADNALQLPALEQAAEVTLINTVPSAMTELIRLGAVGSNVVTVNLAGEPLPATLRDSLYALGSVERVFNLYGPTEDTTYSTFALLPTESTEAPTIGRAIANSQVYILDKHLEVVPGGVAGEVYIGGDGLARGYLNRPDLTAEKFVPNHLGKAGSRLYKTGDLARWKENGEIDYLGRIDHQVKVRGFRIELGEIESALIQHPAIREVVVVARDDLSGGKRLVGYFVCEKETDADINELRSLIREKLPEYMVPSAFVKLEQMPMTPNGKIDRAKLPEPEQTSAACETGYAAPRTSIEEALVNVWAEVLGQAQIGIHDNFFDLGGHSLLATRVASRIKDVLKVEIPLRTVFEEPTVMGLASAIEIIRQQEELDEAMTIQRRPSADKLLTELDGLSEEDVSALLSNMLAEERAY